MGICGLGEAPLQNLTRLAPWLPPASPRSMRDALWFLSRWLALSAVAARTRTEGCHVCDGAPRARGRPSLPAVEAEGKHSSALSDPGLAWKSLGTEAVPQGSALT